MEIDRRDLLLTGLAAAAGAAMLPGFVADAAPISYSGPVLRVPAPPEPPRSPRWNILGPVVSDASFGHGVSGFEALKRFLFGGSWCIARDNGSMEVFGASHTRSALTLGLTGHDAPAHPEDRDFAIRAVYADDFPLPEERDLLRFTHAARFAALHACGICRAHGRTGTAIIAYPATGGMDDAIVTMRPETEGGSWRLTLAKS